MLFDNEILVSEYSNFLRNIEDSKRNLHFNTTKDNLDRVSELLHKSNNQDTLLEDLLNLLQPDPLQDNCHETSFDLTERLLPVTTNIEESFYMQNSSNIMINTSMLR